MRKTIAWIVLFAAAAAPGAFAQKQATEGDTGIQPGSYRSLSALPIVMYDNDIGFGYGAKAKFVDYLGMKESFDFILFNSSKGERWYVFTFSLPDLEIRQGKTYKLSFDLKAEYDKYLKYSYYGQGMDSARDDETIFTHETKNLHLTFGRGFTPRFVAEASYVLRTIDYYGVQDGPYAEELRGLGKKFAPYVSLAVRYDTSNSQIHPTRGVRLLLQDDISASWLGAKDSSFNRITIDLRKYMTVFGEKDVFAVRALMQYIDGSDIPLFDLATLGGGGILNAMRGFGLNRFMDKGKFLANVEYRFPLIWRLGGNLFVDMGNVWNRLGEVDFGKTAVDYGFGLRFYLPDFLVRVDFGFSDEGMRLYFNFGHIF